MSAEIGIWSQTEVRSWRLVTEICWLFLFLHACPTWLCERKHWLTRWFSNSTVFPRRHFCLYVFLLSSQSNGDRRQCQPCPNWASLNNVSRSFSSVLSNSYHVVDTAATARSQQPSTRFAKIDGSRPRTVSSPTASTVITFHTRSAR